MGKRNLLICTAISTACFVAAPAWCDTKVGESKSEATTVRSGGDTDLPGVVVLGSPFGTDDHAPARSYRAEEASTATKTSTPLRETPASVNVVPWDVFAAKRPTALAEAAEVASGVRASCTFGNR